MHSYEHKQYNSTLIDTETQQNQTFSITPLLDQFTTQPAGKKVIDLAEKKDLYDMLKWLGLKDHDDINKPIPIPAVMWDKYTAFEQALYKKFCNAQLPALSIMIFLCILLASGDNDTKNLILIDIFIQEGAELSEFFAAEDSSYYSILGIPLNLFEKKNVTAIENYIPLYAASAQRNLLSSLEPLLLINLDEPIGSLTNLLELDSSKEKRLFLPLEIIINESDAQLLERILDYPGCALKQLPFLPLIRTNEKKLNYFQLFNNYRILQKEYFILTGKEILHQLLNIANLPIGTLDIVYKLLINNLLGAFEGAHKIVGLNALSERVPVTTFVFSIALEKKILRIFVLLNALFHIFNTELTQIIIRSDILNKEKNEKKLMAEINKIILDYANQVIGPEPKKDIKDYQVFKPAHEHAKKLFDEKVTQFLPQTIVTLRNAQRLDQLPDVFTKNLNNTIKRDQSLVEPQRFFLPTMKVSTPLGYFCYLAEDWHDHNIEKRMLAQLLLVNPTVKEHEIKEYKAMSTAIEHADTSSIVFLSQIPYTTFPFLRTAIETADAEWMFRRVTAILRIPSYIPNRKDPTKELVLLNELLSYFNEAGQVNNIQAMAALHRKLNEFSITLFAELTQERKKLLLCTNPTQVQPWRSACKDFLKRRIMQDQLNPNYWRFERHFLKSLYSALKEEVFFTDILIAFYSSKKLPKTLHRFIADFLYPCSGQTHKTVRDKIVDKILFVKKSSEKKKQIEPQQLDSAEAGSEPAHKKRAVIESASSSQQTFFNLPQQGKSAPTEQKKNSASPS